jgi:hypothetical protein
MEIRFIGTKERGYSAQEQCGTASCEVKRVEGGWQAAFAGSSNRNPWVKVEGHWTRYCSCPTVAVPGTFKTRLEAAEAGIAARNAERHSPPPPPPAPWRERE